MLAARALGADLEPACRAAERFESLPHRLELVCERGGVRFVNDSYATRPEAAVAALGAFAGPLALVMGGSEKHADFGELVAAVRERGGVAHVSLIGATAERLERALARGGPVDFAVERHADMEPAVQAAARAVAGGGTVLLAPACASFGLFPNYKVRGERFRAAARAICDLL